ncbi:MAG: hypothetical protein UT61_C0053G0013 [Candidatus Woesebacteria bacterium GW2011_GWA1_39_8]|uniref:Glycosyltransferase RgtA/B/C/D-like domain-containing protein n=1 Tax=Candidatus Woesebacteria bacterium GW2011_GWA1_39_8 TaxID=1618552 RepID=A0A0G0SRQ0_9BACT|nr:MAG: hypothetical protein UT61_C0053G0013 [Candidatus Woesebacteria bacterium GW2011_GWA1_39_8]
MSNGVNPYLSIKLFSLGPPTTLLFYLPFTYLNLQLARQVMVILSILSGYLVCFILAHHLSTKNKSAVFLVLASVFVSAFPTRFALAMGHPTIIYTLFFVLLFYAKSDWVKGVWAALIVLFKANFAVILVSYIKQKSRVLLRGLLILSIAVLSSFIIINPAWYIYFIKEKLFALYPGSFRIANLYYYDQTLKVVMARIGLGGLYMPTYVATLVLGLITVFKTQSLSLGILFSIILSPVVWQHYFVLLFPIFVILFGYLTNIKQHFLWAFSLYLWWTEFPWLQGAGVNLVNGVIASHYFFAAVILTYLIAINHDFLTQTKTT